MARYSIHYSSAGDAYLEACPYSDTSKAPPWHRCVEIPNAVRRRWKAAQRMYYRAQEEMNEFSHAQAPHGSLKFYEADH